MNLARVALIALIAAGANLDAVAQWKWRDPNGVVQYSDLPPPNGTPDKDIFEKPQTFQRKLPPPADAAASAPLQGAAASAPRGVDPELEARRRKADLEKAEKSVKENAAQQAEQERVAALRAENCRRARGSMRTLEDGARIARTNEKGEREVLDDGMRAEEMARVRAVIASDCAAGGR